MRETCICVAKILQELKLDNLPWLVWLSGLSARL